MAAEYVNVAPLAAENYLPTENFARAANLPESVFSDPLLFVDVVREGISGEMLKRGADISGLNRKLIGCALSVDPSNISRLFRRKHLTMEQGEAALETFRLWLKAVAVFEDERKAALWMECAIPAFAGKTPGEMLDTHKGRQLVDNALSRIEFGEFI